MASHAGFGALLLLGQPLLYKMVSARYQSGRHSFSIGSKKEPRHMYIDAPVIYLRKRGDGRFQINLRGVIAQPEHDVSESFYSVFIATTMTLAVEFHAATIPPEEPAVGDLDHGGISIRQDHSATDLAETRINIGLLKGRPLAGAELEQLSATVRMGVHTYLAPTDPLEPDHIPLDELLGDLVAYKETTISTTFIDGALAIGFNVNTFQYTKATYVYEAATAGQPILQDGHLPIVIKDVSTIDSGGALMFGDITKATPFDYADMAISIHPMAAKPFCAKGVQRIVGAIVGEGGSAPSVAVMFYSGRIKFLVAASGIGGLVQFSMENNCQPMLGRPAHNEYTLDAGVTIPTPKRVEAVERLFFYSTYTHVEGEMPSGFAVAGPLGWFADLATGPLLQDEVDTIYNDFTGWQDVGPLKVTKTLAGQPFEFNITRFDIIDSAEARLRLMVRQPVPVALPGAMRIEGPDTITLADLKASLGQFKLVAVDGATVEDVAAHVQWSVMLGSVHDVADIQMIRYDDPKSLKYKLTPKKYKVAYWVGSLKVTAVVYRPEPGHYSDGVLAGNPPIYYTATKMVKIKG